MANWSDLKSAVASIIKTNGAQQITGQLLQNVLNNIISNVGLNSTFAGIATPETNPGTPDGNVFYLATTAGTYSNFNGIVINSGEAVILEWKGSWTKKASGFSTEEKLSELASKTGVEETSINAVIGVSIKQLVCSNIKAGETIHIEIETTASNKHFRIDNLGDIDASIVIVNSNLSAGKKYSYSYTATEDIEKVYFWTIGSNTTISGNINIKVKRNLTLDIKKLQEELGNQSKDIQGIENALKFRGSLTSVTTPIKLTFSNILGSDPRKTANLNVNAGFILSNIEGVSESFLNPQSIDFVDAPYSYGALYCIYNSLNNYAKALRVGGIAGQGGKVVVEDNEYAVPIAVWRNGKVLYSVYDRLELISITNKLEAKDIELQKQIDDIVKEAIEVSSEDVEVVIGEKLNHFIGKVSAGDSVNFTLSSDSVEISYLMVSLSGIPAGESIFAQQVKPGGTYSVTHVMETSGNLYLWTNAPNIKAGGILSYKLERGGILKEMRKSLNEDIEKASYDFAGNVLVPYGSDDYSISFSNKEGEGDKTVCTVEFTHPIILHAISKSFIPVATRTFEKAPWNYGCIVALFEKTGSRRFLRMEATPIGVSPANQFEFNQNEIAVPVIAWQQGQVKYSYQDDRLMKDRITAIEKQLSNPQSKIYITPPAIYSVCNDINWKRNYSLKLYIDHLLAGLNSKPNVKFSNGATSKVFYSKYNSYQSYINSTKPNTTLDVSEVTISDTLSNSENISIQHRSVRNKATADKAIRLLCIGDSVTQGVGAEKGMPYSNSPKQYWSWVKALFEMDNIEAGSGYYFETLGNLQGTSNGGYTFDITDMSGINKSGVKAFACGVGGSKTSDWLSATLNNGVTNPFFDILNNKFSLKYWVENYRTLIVNEDGTTERCNSENKGSLAPSDTTQNNVCEPTHVLIQLGYNQSYWAEGTTRDNYMADIRAMINTIHEEYPNVYILLSLPDTAGTYYPENFAEYIGEGDDIYSLDFNKGTAKDVHNNFAYMNKDLIALSDEDNKVYYCPTYFASPLVYGATVRDISEVAHLASKNDGNKAFVHEGALPQLHPSCVAHANWAYQIYGLLKYTALK